MLQIVPLFDSTKIHTYFSKRNEQPNHSHLNYHEKGTLYKDRKRNYEGYKLRPSE